ncbi:Ketopantoate reductase PanG [Candidatus Syntrophocurvum alkaliphilum]|uniref:Ketopantoate reductase PanG n=1 Tax=Candidatus Syntrophocurvum alkaliphilum TaxID=2293317 RepID=A0A6I6DKQ1_9FIRM|nr:Rossmann-like and DUF2520 domain-containing protein [Candidatus Syntrophocurvum alkaliphilum]QGU00510.1 Ketopantoate reductase PanG [Candidatus Syntrophocurvum alkaliphilum]
MNNKKVGIIGAGVVGTAVGVVLGKKGWDITAVYDINPESIKKFSEHVKCQEMALPQEVSRSVDILFITTSDSAIYDAVDTLVGHKAFHKGQIVIHMSGAQSSEVLDKAKEFGANVLSIHPLQSFASPDMAILNLPGSIFSIEGDEKVHEIGEAIVNDLEGESFVIDRKAKPLYHAGACVVSNYLVTIIDFGVKLLESTGIPKPMATKALMPLVNGTVNNIENIGIPKALTGPIARGDITTITKHVDCLEEMAPEFMKLYSWLGFYTAHIALEKGTIDKETMEEFQKTFIKELSRNFSAS